MCVITPSPGRADTALVKENAAQNRSGAAGGVQGACRRGCAGHQQAVAECPYKQIQLPNQLCCRGTRGQSLARSLTGQNAGAGVPGLPTAGFLHGRDPAKASATRRTHSSSRKGSDSEESKPTSHANLITLNLLALFP